MLPKGNRANFIFWVSPIPVSFFCSGIKKYPTTGTKRTTQFLAGWRAAVLCGIVYMLTR